MCLAIPGKVIEIFQENGLKMGRIDYAGTINQACLEYTPEVKIDEYCLVHAGFAISILNEDEVKNTFQEWDRMLEQVNKKQSDEE